MQTALGAAGGAPADWVQTLRALDAAEFQEFVSGPARGGYAPFAFAAANRLRTTRLNARGG
jgi:hypothetical protein